jgi:hypothetical protein
MNHTKNLPHKAPAPEDIIPGTLYTFNINPKYEYASISSMRTSMMKQLSEVTKTPDNQRTCTYYFHIEFSSTGRLHLHGVVKIHRVIDFYLYTLRKLQSISTYEIDTIQDYNIWSTYCTKQSDLLTREHKGSHTITNNIYIKDESKQITPIPISPPPQLSEGGPGPTHSGS